MTGTGPAPRERHLHVPHDHPAFAGHFPGQPLLPGVVLLAEVMETARSHPDWAARLGEGVTLPQAKFLAPVRPGAALRIVLQEDAAGLKFEVRIGDDVVTAKGQWAWARP